MFKSPIERVDLGVYKKMVKLLLTPFTECSQKIIQIKRRGDREVIDMAQKTKKIKSFFTKKK